MHLILLKNECELEFEATNKRSTVSYRRDTSDSCVTEKTQLVQDYVLKFEHEEFSVACRIAATLLRRLFELVNTLLPIR